MLITKNGVQKGFLPLKMRKLKPRKPHKRTLKKSNFTFTGETHSALKNGQATRSSSFSDLRGKRPKKWTQFWGPLPASGSDHDSPASQSTSSWLVVECRFLDTV